MGCCCSKEEDEGRAPVSVEVRPAAQRQQQPGGGGGGGGVDDGAPPDPAKSVLKRWEDIRQHYVFDKVLGRGQFGVTRLVVHRATGERAACKSISKRKCARARGRRRRVCLRRLLHPAAAVWVARAGRAAVRVLLALLPAHRRHAHGACAPAPCRRLVNPEDVEDVRREIKVRLQRLLRWSIFCAGAARRRVRRCRLQHQAGGAHAPPLPPPR